MAFILRPVATKQLRVTRFDEKCSLRSPESTRTALLSYPRSVPKWHLSSRPTPNLAPKRARVIKAVSNENQSRTPENDDLQGVPLTVAFGSGGLPPDGLPNQGTSVVEGTGNTLTAEDPGMPNDVSYLQELIAIQQSGPKSIGFFGTRNMGFLHQQLIEILSYAMVLTSNHVFTSGATGTNAAVIRGCLRAERPDLLTVILPQSRSKQPSESQDLLKQVANVIEMPENDDMQLIDASRHCNEEILTRVQQVICFAFHDSNLLLETCREAKMMRKIVTLFYLD
ncbi:hypothetical protein CYMTET_31078 [Cymbomonas tetramitiformis]|uniref:Uncharacterized protein n=1 Tax=Cymbomonas tetramitiformis TaxID=36881 RepID=A0AAE0FHR6_9CHLO|nr:hypothetical protein CYMTET_31078 [Cymbomonas tetramitiformis]